MKKFIILVLMLLIVVATYSTTFAASLNPLQPDSKVIISPLALTDEVINYKKAIYVYDSYGQAKKVSSQTVYKTITFRNGYDLVGTREEFETNINGYTIWTFYEYETY